MISPLPRKIAGMERDNMELPPAPTPRPTPNMECIEDHKRKFPSLKDMLKPWREHKQQKERVATPAGWDVQRKKI